MWESVALAAGALILVNVLVVVGLVIAARFRNEPRPDEL